MLASTFLCLALTAIAQDDDETWGPVLFKEGGFAVELPDVGDQQGATPFSAPSGQGTVYQRLRQGGGMIYDVKCYVSPRPIPKGDVERWLSYGRDKEVGFGAHGKLVTEKKIQVGTVAGREFFLQQDGLDTRGRAFVKGSTLIVLVAASGRGNKPLPPKADRFLESFAFGTKPSPAGQAAAQAGQEAENQRKAAAPWKVVPIDGDRVTVEMPGETAKTLGGRMTPPLDGFLCVATNAEGPDVNYSALLFKGMDGNRLARSDEEKGLTAALEAASFRLGGTDKVVADRPFQYQASAGHEYELTIEKRPGTVVKARARAVVADGAIFLVVAIAKAKAKDLPPEATRFLDSLTIRGQRIAAQPPGAGLPEAGGNGSMSNLLVPAVRLILGPTRAALLLGVGRLVAGRGAARPAAMPVEVAGVPAPPPEAATSTTGPAATMPRPSVTKPTAPRSKAGMLAGWGMKVDPDNDVTIKSAKETLTIQIPRSPHVLAPERDIMNAPRVVAPVQGDFVARVRVDGKFEPSDKSTIKGLSSRVAGGLILWKDAENYLVFQHRAAVGDEGKESNQVVLEELVGGKKGATLRQGAPLGPLFLRVERRGTRIAVEFSSDGKRWKDLKPLDATWAEGEIQVGVVAVSTSTEPHAVTFTDYVVQAR